MRDTLSRSRIIELSTIATVIALAAIILPEIAFASGSEGAHGEHGTLGKVLPLWSVIPFVGILLSIALFPLFAPHFWHEHFPKISMFWALILAIPFLIAYRGEAVYEIVHIYLIDYIPFIILLWGLFVASGGILIRGTLQGSPRLNTLILIIGTVIASWIGTTGASMLLIRPLIRANRWRQHQVHLIIFFIFLVSNIGGSLTPLGDPPLFLGFLHSVPFFWTMGLITHMSLVVVILLVLFFMVDTYYYRKEEKPQEVEEAPEPLKVEGLQNFIFLAGIVLAVLQSGLWHGREFNVLGVHVAVQNLLRDGLIILMGLLSLKFTATKTREDNEFTWFPIKEVAFLFAGIFMTIIPALAILKAGVEGSLGWLIESVKTPAHYFWVTGILSSFLDNAPTYLTFFNTALGNFFAGVPESTAVARLIAEQEIYLEAIATGAVFMGANTYIGNAPNFMVRSIAEESGIPMPSFFGYLLKYAMVILVPIFVLVTLVFY
jgi:Na+/H+ antiporter NhaD/arsenite permease-like protein